jgi:hypothetical protein
MRDDAKRLEVEIAPLPGTVRLCDRDCQYDFTYVGAWLDVAAVAKNAAVGHPHTWRAGLASLGSQPVFGA